MFENDFNSNFNNNFDSNGNAIDPITGMTVFNSQVYKGSPLEFYDRYSDPLCPYCKNYIGVKNHFTCPKCGNLLF